MIDNGVSCVVCVNRGVNGVNAVRAPLEPRASLIVRAPLAQGVLQDGRTGLSGNVILCIFGHILG